MKNYWLEQRKKGDICPNCGESYWLFNDENTLMQGDPMCGCNTNLDIWYNYSFVQNEEGQLLEFKDGIATYQIIYTPIVAGTLSAYMPYQHTYFAVNQKGVFNFRGRSRSWTQFETPPEDTKIDSKSCTLNLLTGIIQIGYNDADAPEKILFSYEYNIER